MSFSLLLPGDAVPRDFMTDWTIDKSRNQSDAIKGLVIVILMVLYPVCPEKQSGEGDIGRF